jgi:hypothetical protein
MVFGIPVLGEEAASNKFTVMHVLVAMPVSPGVKVPRATRQNSPVDGKPPTADLPPRADVLDYTVIR